MSGGFRNSAIDSPGKRNTRSKYSVASVVSPSVNPLQIAPVMSHGPVMLHDNHWHTGGYFNPAAVSHGNYSSRVNYSSIISAAPHSIMTVPAAFHGPVGLPLAHVYHNGGFHNLSIRPSIAPSIQFAAPIMAHAHPVRGGYYNLPAESPGKYSSRVKYTSILHGVPPAMYTSYSSAAAPLHGIPPMYTSYSSVPAPLHGIPQAMYTSYSSVPAPSASTSSAVVAPNPSTAARVAVSQTTEAAGPSQQQIDAVQKQYGGAYTCIVQVVKARTSDPEQNFFSDEYDGEGLSIDEAAVRKMLQSLPPPLVLQSIQNKGKCELKFVVQNTASKLSSDFIITFNGGDIDICSAD